MSPDEHFSDAIDIETKTRQYAAEVMGQLNFYSVNFEIFQLFLDPNNYTGAFLLRRQNNGSVRYVAGALRHHTHENGTSVKRTGYSKEFTANGTVPQLVCIEPVNWYVNLILDTEIQIGNKKKNNIYLLV